METKYYLYDIQNDNKVCEVEKDLYDALEECIFNIKMLDFLINNGFFDSDVEEALDKLYDCLFFDLDVPQDKIYEIIEIGIDN